MIRIMIIEDDEEFAWPMYERMFEHQTDMEIVHRATHWAEVWGADFDNVDVILMDGSVERQDDGYAATERVLSEHPRIKVILSSYAPDRRKAESMGAVASVTKKFEGEEAIRSAIREAVA